MGTSSLPPDPTYLRACREGKIIAIAWTVSMTAACGISFALGREGGPQLEPIAGVPAWVVWGVFAPWLIAGAFSIAFAAVGMTDDDLGKDHAEELEADIQHEGAAAHGD